MISKPLTFVVLITIIVALAACARFGTQRSQKAVPSGAGVFFVATNGNDHWSGRTAAANRSEKDGPFQSLNRALQAAAELKQQQGGVWKQPVSIFLRGGIHWLGEPIVITTNLSGIISAPLTISAYPGEQPLLSAGRSVSGWKLVTIDDKSLWVASVPSGSKFHQLWVNGKRRPCARHPNSGCLTVAGTPDATPSWESGQKRFSFKAGDVMNWKSASQGEAIVMTRWVESRLPIVAIDEKERVLTSNKRSVLQIAAGDPYYLENIFETLDQPGEWFLDRERSLLYYQPLPGEEMASIEAIAPRLPEHIRLEGKLEAGQFVEYVRFRGLTFSHNEWFYPPNFGCTERHISNTPDPEIFSSSQAAFNVPGAIRAEAARNCSFEDCKFSNLGSYGLQLGRGCHTNLVSHCEFSHLAAGGIRIGETLLRSTIDEQAHDNEISDCEIFDGGTVFPSTVGIFIIQSPKNRIAHNAIHDFFYTGLSIGWTWGYEASAASNNIVEFNHIHHIGRKANGESVLLGDMGAIYTLGIQPGTVLRNNLLHDVDARYAGWGIYFDEGSSHIIAENNVVLRTTQGGFHQHYGRENIVRNNIFAFSRDSQLQRSRAEGHSSFTFERNIVYFDSGKLLESDWTNGKFDEDYNVYFDARTNAPGLNFPGGIDKWREAGHGAHSVIANPHFSTTNLAEVRLEADSPALQLGFKPFDLRTVGPRHNR